jgi:hypothetical protein
LIPLDIPGDGVFREPDAIFIQELGSDLRDRPMSGAPPMSDPTEDIPTDDHLGQSDGDLELGALGLEVAGAAGIGAVIEPAKQLDRSIEPMQATMPVVTDMHRAPTAGAIAVDDVEFPEGEIRLRGPRVGHPADLHVMVNPQRKR